MSISMKIKIHVNQKNLQFLLLLLYSLPNTIPSKHSNLKPNTNHTFQYTFSLTRISTNIFKQQFSIFKHTYQTGPQCFEVFFGFKKAPTPLCLIRDKTKRQSSKNATLNGLFGTCV